MVTSLLFVFLIQNSSAALGLILDSPDETEVNEEFTVSIDADASETHDVKIFVHDSEGGTVTRDEYTSEILNGEEWADPWFYLLGAFPGKKSYKIKVVKDVLGWQNICVKLRNAETEKIFTTCNEIEIIAKESKQEETEKQEEQEEAENQEEEEPTKEIESDSQEPVFEQEVPEEEKLLAGGSQQEEKIILAPKLGEEEPFPEISTKDEKVRTWITYFFIGLCVFIIVLLALRKL